MEFKLLNKDELKNLQKLCVSGENWADVYYNKLDSYYTGNVKTYAISNGTRYLAELTAYEDELEKYDSLAIKGETVHLLDHKVLRELREQGLGKKLLKYVCCLYKNRGYKSAVVRISNRDSFLIDYYKKYGFNKVFLETDAYVILMNEFNVEV